MSQHTNQETNDSHGSYHSYVIGFALSLVFTIIPYIMVTRGSIRGDNLLVIILAFAIIQMFIQIFFFLHLGRGPKPLYNVIFFFATSGLIVLVIGASILIMNSLYRNMSPQEIITRVAQDENIAEINGQETGACKVTNENHIVTIKDNQIIPENTTAKRCDTLSFSIEDGMDRMIMFGIPDTPISYGGMADVMVRSDRTKIITLNEAGDFSFHDHSNQEVVGTFTVEP